MEKVKRGGKRRGAGRKPADYKTKTISFRVREEWESDIKMCVKNKVNDLLKILPNEDDKI